MAEVIHAHALITWAGRDVTESLAPYIEELTYTDSAEKGSKDELSIRLDNTDGRFWRDWFPEAGDILEASIVWEDDGSHQMPLGAFTMDRLDFRFSPKTCTVRALSYPDMARDALKQTMSRAFENTSMVQILTTLAGECGLTPLIDCPDVPLARLDMRSESVEHLCVRLAREYGCKFNVKGGYLVFDNAPYPQSLALDLDANRDVISGNLSLKPRERVKAAHMDYYDPETRQNVTYTAGDPQASGDQVKKIYGQARSMKEARQKCEQAMTDGNIKDLTGDLTLIGLPVCAGTTVTINGLGNLSGEYEISRAVHSMTRTGGWTVRTTINRARD